MRKREKRDELLLLTAVSGEIPANWIGEAAGSKDYGSALLTKLKKEGGSSFGVRTGYGDICCGQRERGIFWKCIGRMWSCFLLVLGQRTM